MQLSAYKKIEASNQLSEQEKNTLRRDIQTLSTMCTETQDCIAFLKKHGTLNN